MKGLKHVLTKFLGAMGCCLIALGCGETTEEEAPRTNAGAIDAYLGHLKPATPETAQAAGLFAPQTNG